MEVRANINRFDLFKIQFLLLFRIGVNYIFFGIIYGVIAFESSELLLKGEIIAWLLSFIITGTIATAAAFLIMVFMQTIAASAEKGFIGNIQYLKLKNQGSMNIQKGLKQKQIGLQSQNYIKVKTIYL